MKVPVDPAGDGCYEYPIKPCKSSSNTGELLSNTSVTCPTVGHNLGKLRVILDRRCSLEWLVVQTRAVGWAGG